MSEKGDIEQDNLHYWENQARRLRIDYHEETSLQVREELYLAMDYAESMVQRLTGSDDEEEYYNNYTTN